jgi:DNA polymerase-3 subunit delta
VIDDLMTLPMLSPRRLVTVEDADPFVTRERARLEKLFSERAEGGETSGVLVLDVKSWPGNTKLAKLTPDAWLITCDTPDSRALPKWCVEWCKERHGKALDARAAALLVELVGQEMGLLDSEMEKLAAYAGDAPKIDARDVDTLVGQSRLEDTWKIFDLIGAGKGGEALAYVRRLFAQGKEPLELLGAFSVKMRQLARAARLQTQGTPLGDAMAKAEVKPFARQAAEQQMRHLGRRRLDRLYDMLLEADQGMKGGSQLPPQLLMERLVVQLARAR